ncbi:hypothetical protein ACNKHN_02620 [Shigella flexneri]
MNGLFVARWRNRFLVLMGGLFLRSGTPTIINTPVDALPDLPTPAGDY